MNNKKEIDNLLASNSGLVYSDKDKLYFAEVFTEKQSNEFISFFDIFGVLNKKLFIGKRVPLNISNARKKKIQKPLMNSVIFEDDFYSICKSIEQNIINKALWYNYYQTSLQTKSFQNLISNALNSYSSHLLIFWDGDFLSITNSPEVLFEQVSPDTFTTDCIAATAASPIQLEQDKFIREHRNVETNLLEKIEKITDIYSIEKKKIIGYSNYYHYKSSILFKTDIELETLIRSLAPTSAIFGDPTEKVREISQMLHYYKENPSPVYGGPILINQEDTTKALVNIRNLTVNMGKAQITTGCGIVSGSTFSAELAESRMKMESVLEFVCG